MGRPVYPHELGDADFAWLINSFREKNAHCAIVESSCLPVVLLKEVGISVTAESGETAVTPAEPIEDIPEAAIIGRKLG